MITDQSLKIGSITLPSRLIQGPLAGYSCAPFRALAQRYGQPAFCCSEMISVDALLHHPLHIQKRYLARDQEEQHLCYQLSSTKPKALAEATKIVTDLGADFIDLNCGCPVKKIRRKGAGSKLLSTPDLLAKLIEAMRNNTDAPISIKIRVDGDSDERFNDEVAKVVANSGVDYLVVHGRHWSERYDVACHYDDIQHFVESLSIPVIGNGDIDSVESLQMMLATGCAGVMISRAAMGRPWLFEQLRQGNFAPPSQQTVLAVFFEHISKLAELIASEKAAVLQARAIARYYTRQLNSQTNSKSLLDRHINNCHSLADIEKLVVAA